MKVLRVQHISLGHQPIYAESKIPVIIKVVGLVHRFRNLGMGGKDLAEGSGPPFPGANYDGRGEALPLENIEDSNRKTNSWSDILVFTASSPKFLYPQFLPK